MNRPGAGRLEGMLARNHELAERILQTDFPLSEFEHLQTWQQARIARSFDDMMQQPGYRPAVVFFLEEIYGGLDFRERDQDMSKVMPVMIRFLPDRTLMTMSEAFELQAISLEFDMDMAANMAVSKVDELDMERYCDVYRACSQRDGRERQIQLIRKLGYDLERLVRWPMVNTLVRLLRGPAHAAGFGALQEFLESGLVSFRALEDPVWFVETIFEREWGAMEAMFGGSNEPFGF
ncbi:MAG: hypothetical protein HKP03_04585, partial [Xanthomonadales bacterium]|nr:hypothetical protein [Gammaproteobacteria bacterium]NNK37732.1 hypothetical protein [Xanthomonadales bacterium]